MANKAQHMLDQAQSLVTSVLHEVRPAPQTSEQFQRGFTAAMMLLELNLAAEVARRQELVANTED